MGRRGTPLRQVHPLEKVVEFISHFEEPKIVLEVSKEVGCRINNCHERIKRLIEIGLLKKVAEIPTMPYPWVRKHVFQITELGKQLVSKRDVISSIPLRLSIDFRQEILKRDGYMCQNCGNKGKHVHHKDGDIFNNEPSNLITLCRKCHMATHRKT